MTQAGRAHTSNPEAGLAVAGRRRAGRTVDPAIALPMLALAAIVAPGCGGSGGA